MKRVVKRLGVVAFLFFFIKGMLWLLIPAGIGLWAIWGGQDEASGTTSESINAGTISNDTD